MKFVEKKESPQITRKTKISVICEIRGKKNNYVPETPFRCPRLLLWTANIVAGVIGGCHYNKS